MNLDVHYRPLHKPAIGPYLQQNSEEFMNRIFFLRWEVVSSSTNPQAGESLLIGCPRLLIQQIRSYPPYLEAVSPIRNLRMRPVAYLELGSGGGGRSGLSHLL